ncbi:DNA polymerase III subunit chi [Blochmannia endosymbiont of Camponotus (Colobopsis) obliquus]|uniref:DNA polymerase III subunit chi n=1 Tax=Blochmannia endosymbiont of Camponotus (Colobopsis) obliquus TaxID=1505597 RepID=UPI00061A82BB|nr:DNA polymerase III subunit chi [Blochmannia endosymbiont of Camponotus (Colobopsis) obliquus]AKC60218.1 DNA polymerase III subunit chi [Blochmannia endosymbiont of Camponotus (Colobopsis) obliquus]
MQTVTFYILNKNITHNKLTPTETFACKIAIIKWREGNRILIICNNNNQAININTALWEYEINSFIPHDLIKNKKIEKNIPILISSQYHKIKTQNVLLITLITQNIKFSHNFNNVIELVPNDELSKQWARQRYKEYKKIGATLITVKTYEKK